MTHDEKLNHLRDWLDFYVFCKISNVQLHYMTFDLYEETGNLIYKLPIEAVPFEMYLETAQLIGFTIEYK